MDTTSAARITDRLRCLNIRPLLNGRDFAGDVYVNVVTPAICGWAQTNASS